jgi:putative phosphoesterase
MDTIKILIVSDSHGTNKYIKQAIQKEKPFNYLVHCGDIEGTLKNIDDNVDYEIKAVKGNCDHGHDLEEEILFKAGFFNIWVIHGENLRVKSEMNLDTLKKEAKKRRADIVLFGHTHQAETPEISEDGITYINPGSIGEPRTSAEKISYATLTINEDYEIITEIKFLESI